MKETILLVISSIGVLAAVIYGLSVILFRNIPFEDCGNVGEEE